MCAAINTMIKLQLLMNDATMLLVYYMNHLEGVIQMLNHQSAPIMRVKPHTGKYFIMLWVMSHQLMVLSLPISGVELLSQLSFFSKVKMIIWHTRIV